MTDDLDARNGAWAQWRDDVAHLGGTNTLLHFNAADGGTIDLTSGHPGGLAQLLSGHMTKLSNLIREDRAFVRAYQSMVGIDQNAAQLAEDRGIDTVSLAVGLASWSHEGESFVAPVLIQPAILRQVYGDFEIRFAGRPRLNPALELALREQFGLGLDADAFAALAVVGSSFNPQLAFDRLASMTRHMGRFVVSNRLILATLTDVIHAMTQRMTPTSHPVLDALARVPGAGDELAYRRKTVGVVSSDDRAIGQDTLVLDTGSEHERVVAQIAAGSSMLVQTVPGAGVTQTMVNALGALIADGKRVAVLAANRDQLREVARKLEGVGLAGVAVTPASLDRDIIGGIGRNEKAGAPKDGDLGDVLVRIRTALTNYRAGLTTHSSQFGVSVLQTVGELARLSSLPHPPTTTARLGGDGLRYVAAHRSEVVDQLEMLGDLGEFNFSRDNSAWHGAHFDDPDDARATYVIAKRLSETDVPQLIEKSAEIFDRAGITAATSLTQIGAHIRMLLGVRDALDKFLPEVFDRSLADLIRATSPDRDNGMSSGDRRRLRQLAKEYVRPGMHVADMHVSLAAIDKLRGRWLRVSIRPRPPMSPAGLSDLHTLYSAVASDVKQLDGVIDRMRLGSLPDVPLEQLTASLAALTDDVDALTNLRERTELVSALAEHGLQPVIDDFASRNVPKPRIRIELEQAWWQSVLEYLVEDDRSLFGADAQVLARLESDFAKVDAAHMGANPKRLAWRMASRWSAAIAQFPNEAARLRTRLRAREVSAQSLMLETPHLLTVVAPVWLLSPYTFAQAVPASMHFDTVLVVDGASVGVPESALPIAQSDQVVVFGDPVLYEPQPFHISSGKAITPAEVDAAASDDAPGSQTPASLYTALSGLLPRFQLTHTYRAGGRALARIVNERFYEGRIDAWPAATELIGKPPLDLVYVERGTGIPDPISHLVEAVPAEIAAVVDLVFAHATWRPRESLMVISVSDVHARRVRAAVREELKRRPELESFFSGERAEPFVVLTIAQAASRSRDRVIFSIGLGRTAHGRVLSDFGPLSRPGGRRLAALAFTRARRNMTLVSCFKPSDLDPERLEYGAADVAAILNETVPDELTAVPTEAEPLLIDLANRLDALGAQTEINYGGAIDLVASVPGIAVAIETDQRLQQGTLREMIRLRPAELHRLGWQYRRVYTFDLFADPQRVADSIAVQLKLKEPPMATEPGADDARIVTSDASGRRRATLPAERGGEVDDQAAFDETAQAWGDKPDDEDNWLLSQRPPHWG